MTPKGRDAMPQEPNCHEDIVPRKNPKHFRIATFNVENLFGWSGVAPFQWTV